MKETEVVESDAPGDTELFDSVRRSWAEVLGIETEEVPIDTNFLEADGNSMLLIMLWEELNKLTDAPLRVSDLFQHATVKAQVTLLTGGQGADGDAAEMGVRDRGRLLGRSRGGRSTTGQEGEAR